jgi:hypothetical protein
MADMKERRARARRVGESDRRAGAGRCLPGERSGGVGGVDCARMCPYASEDALWVVVAIDLPCCWVPVICSDKACAYSAAGEGPMEATWSNNIIEYTGKIRSNMMMQ